MQPVSQWENTCVLCAARGRQTRLETGHVCAPCLTHIGDQLDDVLRLAALATVEPRTSTGSGSRSIPSSRPPINVDGVCPELTLVMVATEWTTVLAVLESWEVLIRDARRMPAYGPVSALRAIRARRGFNDTSVTLTGVTGFLRASLPWWQARPDMPIEDFANEVRQCRRAMAHYDPDRQSPGYAAYCPTDDCGAKLHYQQADEEVTCRRCGTSRDVPTLVAVIISDPDRPDIWADVATASQHYGITERRLRQMAVEGKVQRKAGKYRIALRRVGIS